MVGLHHIYTFKVNYFPNEYDLAIGSSRQDLRQIDFERLPFVSATPPISRGRHSAGLPPDGHDRKPVTSDSKRKYDTIGLKKPD